MASHFSHQHTAHCESGVLSTLFKTQGIEVNEALVFGLAAALTFVYIPVLKMSGMPLVSYRTQPRSIIRRCSKILNARLGLKRFTSPQEGMAALDDALSAGKTVGLQTSVFWLPYFPAEMRFHFNAHNLLVYGKEAGDYLISDPVFETVQRCPAEDLQRARFAKGALAAKGLMYTLDRLPENFAIDAETVYRAVKRNARQMLAPVFFVGVKGICSLARAVAALENGKNSADYAKLFLGHIVRMQEEIGTGGAGFRYIYAYFLEQAADICSDGVFRQASQELTDIGDEWRRFAALCVRQCRKPQQGGFQAASQALSALADREEHFWRALSVHLKGRR